MLPAPPPQQAMPPVISQYLPQARLLVVEDDPLMQAMLSKLLAPHVAEVILAENGAEGLDKWIAHQPDIVLTDVSMPVMDGLALSEAIKSRDPGSQIIVISSFSRTHDLRRAIDIGIERYVLKPVDGKLLIDAVAKCMRDRHHLLELQMAKMVFEVANEGILVTDAVPRIIAINPAFSAISGYCPDEIIGQKTSILASGLHDPEYYRAMWETIKTHGRWSGEIINRRKNGETYAEWLSIAAVPGKFRGVQGYVGVISDITERKKHEEHIRHLAHFDSLTGLPNRVLFADRLQRAIASAHRHHTQLSILFLDLDYFKTVNDTCGHAMGDEVLRIVARRMQDCIRQSDTVSRRGGDEFVFLLECGEEPEGPAVVCRRLIESIAQPIAIGNHYFNIGASIGVAMFPADAEDIDTLLSAADFALYEAKVAGRGCFHFFQPEAQQQVWVRLDMEKELREGLKDWRFSLYYLPEISLVSGKVENVEALLRFHHPRHGLLEAGRFLEIAEEIGILPELGERTLGEVSKELAILASNWPELGLVIDLSACQLSAPNVVDRLLDTLAHSGLPASHITFECPEGALTENSAAMQTVFRLAAAGYKFTLDDFGAGYSSFNLIRQLPMSSIKIDRSFVNEIDTSAQSRELVAALIVFCKRLGLRTVAEGVETSSQLAFLRENQCDAAQGYVFGKPMDFVALQTYFSEQNWRQALSV